MANTRTQFWCFTLNNYTDEDCYRIEDIRSGAGLVCDKHVCTYGVVGKEVGASGTPHLQGYLELEKKVRLSTIRKEFDGRAHFEARRGTGTQAADYCKKDASYVEWGALKVSEQGRRSDLEVIKAKLDAGASSLKIAEEHFSKWVVYRRSFDAYCALRCPPTMRGGLRVYVLYGSTGVGKSRFVHWRHEDVYTVPTQDLQWFDGYSQQRVALLDDYRGDGNSSFLLRVLDVYPLRVPVKGGFVAWNPDVIYITSNMRPDCWHADIVAPLMRRIHHVEYIENNIDFEDETALEDLKNKMPFE